MHDKVKKLEIQKLELKAFGEATTSVITKKHDIW